MQRALEEIKQTDLQVEFRHVPPYLGIYDKEKVEKLTKAALQRTHTKSQSTHQDLVDIELDRMTDEIIVACRNVHT